MRSRFTHYGEVVRHYRMERGMTQHELAERWPSVKREGVGVRLSYVQAVEAGDRTIGDIEMLRRLCRLLSIPPEEFGLAEHDPFHPELDIMLPGTCQPMSTFLELADMMIMHFEESYKSKPLPQAEREAQQLYTLFDKMNKKSSPPLHYAQEWRRLWTQVINLKGVIHLGKAEYKNAYRTFKYMLQESKGLEEKTMQAHACLTVGTELGRMGRKKQAVEYLEAGRDLTFQVSNKAVASYLHAYLARALVEHGETGRAERAIKTALDLAPESYGDGTGFIYHTRGGLLAEQSHVYLQSGRPEQALAIYEQMEEQTWKEGNIRVWTWVPLDKAQAQYQQGEIEGSVEHTRQFYSRALQLEAAHPQRRAREFAAQLYQDYPDVLAVRDLYGELCTK